MPEASPPSGSSELTEAAAGYEEASVHPEVQRCLDLVAQAEFQRAVPVCLEAAKLDPANEQIQAALAKAQTQVASLGDAQAAAKGAAAAQSEAAASQLDEAAKGLPGRPGL